MSYTWFYVLLLDYLRLKRTLAMLDTADVELIGLSKLSRISVIQLASLQKINQQYIQNIYVYTKKCVLQLSTLPLKE